MIAGATPDAERLAGLPAVRVAPRRSGRPLVLVPGLNDPLHTVSDSRWFPWAVARYCRRYADRGPVYYVGQPRDADATIAAIADGYGPAVATVADRHGAAPALLGLSMGGFLVAELAAAHPENVDRAVLGLAADRVDRASGRDRLRRWDEYAAAGRFDRVYHEASAVVARGPLRATMQAAGAVYDRVRSPTDPGAFVRAVAACLDYDGAAALERIADAGVATLVVGGDDDPFFTDEGFDRAARLADGRRVRLRGAAHDAVLSRSSFARVVRRFLSSGA